MSGPEKSEDIYVRLVDALDALPHGFPRTPSGVEIKLIKLAFTPEEVWLASQLTRIPETAAEIAKRVGRDVAEVTATLESLIPRRLVRLDSPGMSAPGLAPTVEGEKRYRLGPFLVGWYESNMRLLDKEFAELFEQFVIEGGGERIFAPRPGVLGVVPVRGSLKPEHIRREPHLDIDAHFARHERFLVLPCVCKREMELLHGESCRKPMKRCGFVGLPPQTPLGETVLDREEASKLLDRLEKQGHVHLAFYGFTMSAESPQFVGTCNCCSCCCGVFHGQKLAGVAEGPQRSNYRAVVDAGPLHGLRRLHQAVPGGRHLRGPEALAHGASLCGCGVGARQVGGGPGQVHRLRRLRDRVPHRCHRDGAGLRGGVVPRPVEHGRVGRDAPGVSGRAEVTRRQTAKGAKGNAA